MRKETIEFIERIEEARLKNFKLFMDESPRIKESFTKALSGKNGFIDMGVMLAWLSLTILNITQADYVGAFVALTIIVVWARAVVAEGFTTYYRSVYQLERELNQTTLDVANTAIALCEDQEPPEST